MKNKKMGQAIAEYLILVAIIAVGSMAIVRLLQENIDRKLARVNNAIAGSNVAGPEGIAAEQKHYKRRDMSNFHDDAASDHAD